MDDMKVMVGSRVDCSEFRSAPFAEHAVGRRVVIGRS